MLILVCLFVLCSSFWRTWLSGWYLISPSLPLSKIITWCRQLQLLHSVWDIGEWSRHRCTPGGYTLAPSSEKKKQNQIIISIIVCCFFWPRNNMNTFLQWWGSSWHPILWEKREGRIKMQTWRGQQLREQTPEIDLKLKWNMECRPNECPTTEVGRREISETWSLNPLLSRLLT